MPGAYLPVGGVLAAGACLGPRGDGSNRVPPRCRSPVRLWPWLHDPARWRPAEVVRGGLRWSRARSQFRRLNASQPLAMPALVLGVNHVAGGRAGTAQQDASATKGDVEVPGDVRIWPRIVRRALGAK